MTDVELSLTGVSGEGSGKNLRERSCRGILTNDPLRRGFERAGQCVSNASSPDGALPPLEVEDSRRMAEFFGFLADPTYRV